MNHCSRWPKRATTVAPARAAGRARRVRGTGRAGQAERARGAAGRARRGPLHSSRLNTWPNLPTLTNSSKRRKWGGAFRRCITVSSPLTVFSKRSKRSKRYILNGKDTRSRVHKTTLISMFHSGFVRVTVCSRTTAMWYGCVYSSHARQPAARRVEAHALDSALREKRRESVVGPGVVEPARVEDGSRGERGRRWRAPDAEREVEALEVDRRVLVLYTGHVARSVKCQRVKLFSRRTPLEGGRRKGGRRKLGGYGGCACSSKRKTVIGYENTWCCTRTHTCWN